MLFFYDLIYIFFFLCYLPILFIRGKYHSGFSMRLGRFPQGIVSKKKRTIWLHAVSVGEAGAVATLVKDLKREFPESRLVISTVTKTGNRIARRLIDKDDLTIFAPLDIGFICRRAIEFIDPEIFIVVETEIWPNLIVNLAKKKIPIVLINGRVSGGSFRGYRIIRPLIKAILKRFTLLCMQTKEDAQRIIELGAEEDRVKVTGNMKFDIQKTEDSDRRESRAQARESQKSELGLSEAEKLFIAGSTHPGEEGIVLRAYKDLINTYPGLRLLIAPRHIERTKEIKKLILKFGFESQKISQLNSTLPPTTYHLPPVLVLDTIGQLKELYALSDLVFIGGSLIPRGGQNPLEAAVFSKPILFGPYMYNFSNIAGLFIKRGAAIMVRDANELREHSLQLLKNPALRQQLGARAKDLIEENKGTTLRNLQLLKGVMNVRGEGMHK
jgi:3-deoxy-D-manno-octulosonic-acid transferase